MGTIIAFKLVNGDEIIGELEAEDAVSVTLRKPLTVVQTGQNAIAFVQIMFSVSEHTVIPYFYSGMATAPVEASLEFSKVYKGKTSGLILGN